MATPFLSDFEAYLNQPHVRDRVRTWIVDKLHGNGAVVVVGHSMGSLVALDVLHDLPYDTEVLGLVTIGSPLPYRDFHTLLEDHHLSRAARRARMWINIADPADETTGSAAVSTSWLPAEVAIDFSVDNAKLAGTPNAKVHDASLYVQQPGFALAVHRLIARRAMPCAWDPVYELTQVREQFEASGRGDVTFMSRLRAVSVSREHRLATSNREWPKGSQIASTPDIGLNLQLVMGFMSTIACAFWTPDGRYRVQKCTTLDMLFFRYPFVELQQMILQVTEDTGRRLTPALPLYAGLPPESPLWDRRVSGLFHLAPDEDGRLGKAKSPTWSKHLKVGALRLDPQKPDDAFFLMMRAIVESQIYLGILRQTPRFHSRLSAWFSRQLEDVPETSSTFAILQRGLPLLDVQGSVGGSPH